MRIFRNHFGVYLFSSFIGDLVLPIFALFLPLLAYRLGADPLEVGLVGGASYSVYSFMPFIMGHYSDRRKTRKVFIVVSLCLLVVTSLLYTFASSPVQLIFFRILEGLGWATFWPTMDAAIGEDVSREVSKSFSIFNSIWSAAAALGPLVGVVFAVLFTEIRYVFLVTAGILLATTLMNLMGLKEIGNVEKDSLESFQYSSESLTNSGGREELGVATVRTIGFFMVVVAAGAAVRGILFTFFPPLAQSRGLSIPFIGAVAFVFGASRFVAFIATIRDDVRGILLRRTNVRRNALIALAISSFAGALPILSDRSGALYFISFILTGAALSFTVTMAQVGMIAETDRRRMGGSAGLFESSVGIGAALGPIVAGLVSGGSLISPFYLPPLSLLVVVPILLAFFRR